MLVKTYNQTGEEIEKTNLPKEIFEVPLNRDLVWQVTVSQMANRRKPIAHTKDRSEVRGGGKKPWKQKGLGRARHGSIRSPLWRHGGITFGPRTDKSFAKKIPKRMKKLALKMVLSEKLRNNLLILIDKLKIEKPKTKLILEIFKKLPLREQSFLLALPAPDKNLIFATRNIPKSQTILVKDLNCLDLLSFKYLILPKDSIKIIKEKFEK